MNALISNAVARGWISFPDPVAVPARAEVPTFNSKRAWKMWNEGQIPGLRGEGYRREEARRLGDHSGGTAVTREQTIEAIGIMQAYVDGNEVEVQRLLAGAVWIPTGAPCWDWLNSDYRIKPTATLRPWTADEVPLGAWMTDSKNVD